MCMICVELIKHKMTLSEASRNATEMVGAAKSEEELFHYKELADAIYELDLKKLDKLLDEGSDGK